MDKTLLIHIKYGSYKDPYDILRSFHLEKHLLIKNCNRSAIATITICIYLLKSKLKPCDLWEVIFQMKILRDHLSEVKFYKNSLDRHKPNCPYLKASHFSIPVSTI